MLSSKQSPGLRIAIIGGGPAGSFTCHFLNKLAKAAGREIKLDIYDYKCFSCRGKSNCNMCAGIISATLTAKLEKEHITIPKSVIKSEITGYQLHSKYNTVYFQKEGSKKIYSVFRGQGPPQVGGKANSFDQFLLDDVCQEPNVTLIAQQVQAIDFSHPDHAIVLTAEGIHLPYDFIIGAFGVNTTIKDILNTGYAPPQTMKFFQLETNYPEDFISRTYKDRVQMFPVFRHNIWFITLTPKWNFVTVTAVGPNVQLDDVRNELLSNENIRLYLPGEHLNIRCSCAPQLPVGFARKPYSHRFIAVGDACVSRFMKNGIQSAFQTAYFAADTIIHFGITEKILKKYYFQRCQQEYSWENRYGKLLYLLDRLLYLFPLYAEAHIIMAKKEQLNGQSSRFSDILWDMFTGDSSYKHILKHSLHPKLILGIGKEMLRLMWVRLFKGKAAI